MQLSALLDALVDPEVDEARGRAARSPCRAYDPELWFAELPADVEEAKALCAGSARPARPASPARWSGASPGASGAASSSSQGVVVPRKRPRGRPRKSEVARDDRLRIEPVAQLNQREPA